MKFPEHRTTSILLTILLFAAVLGVAYAARYVILLFILSVFFAYLMYPAVRFLEHHSFIVRNLRGLAVTELYVALLILIGVGLYNYTPTLLKHSVKLVDQVPDILDRLSSGEIANDIGDKYGWSDQQKSRLKTVLLRHREELRGLQDWIDTALSQAARIAGWLALIPVLAIFLLQDGRIIVEGALQLLLPQRRRGPARMIACELHAMLTNYIRAQVLLCLFSLGFYLAVLLLFRFPHAFALAAFGAILEFIPVIGWMTTAAVIVGIGMANHLYWLWMVALLLLWRLAQDYLNLPRALGHNLKMHPLTVIFAVLAGGEVGGIIGIYLAVPLAASLLLILRMQSAAENPASDDAAPAPAGTPVGPDGDQGRLKTSPA